MDDLEKKGIQIRSEVVGKEFVDNAMKTSAEINFGMPLQELVNKYCWGEVWGRPGLPRKTRSIINIAMLSALNRPNELKVHTAGALRNGCSEDEIMEIILQVAIYCGMPAAMVAYKVAKEVILEHREKGTPA